MGGQPCRPALRLEFRVEGGVRGLCVRRREGEVPARLRRCMDEGHEPRPLRSEKVLRTARKADRGIAPGPRAALRVCAGSLLLCKVAAKRATASDASNICARNAPYCVGSHDSPRAGRSADARSNAITNAKHVDRTQVFVPE